MSIWREIDAHSILQLLFINTIQWNGMSSIESSVPHHVEFIQCPGTLDFSLLAIQFNSEHGSFATAFCGESKKGWLVDTDGGRRAVGALVGRRERMTMVIRAHFFVEPVIFVQGPSSSTKLAGWRRQHLLHSTPPMAGKIIMCASVQRRLLWW